MKIVDKVLVIEPHDFDHIMDWSGNECPSEAFKEGLEIELKMHGYEDKPFEKIELNISRRESEG